MNLLILSPLLALPMAAGAQSGVLDAAKARAQQQIYGNNPEVCAMFFASGDPKAAAKAYSLGCSRPAPAAQSAAPQPRATQIQCVSKNDPDHRATALWSGNRFVFTSRTKGETYITSAVKDPSLGDFYKIVAFAANGEPVVPPHEHVHMYVTNSATKSTGTFTRLSAWDEASKAYYRKVEIQFSCDPATQTTAIPVVAAVAPPPAAKGSSYDEFCAAKPDICKGHLAAVVKHAEGRPGSDCINTKGASLKTIYEAVNAWSIKNPQQTSALFVARPDSELRLNHNFFISDAMAELYPCQR